MNTYVVYTTEGSTSGPNTDIDIENCQILGFIDEISEIRAIEKLFDQNRLFKLAAFLPTRLWLLRFLLNLSKPHLRRPPQTPNPPPRTPVQQIAPKLLNRNSVQMHPDRIWRSDCLCSLSSLFQDGSPEIFRRRSFCRSIRRPHLL